MGSRHDKELSAPEIYESGQHGRPAYIRVI